MQPDVLIALVWGVVGFASGSLMFSYWLGRCVLRRDIRAVGDGNPGSTNVLRAGGRGWGALAFALDALKGAVPVALAKWVFGVTGWPLVIAAVAPIFGHAFSPFLRFRGGKAVAVTAGVWMALTIWEAPTFGGLALGLWFSIVVVSGWAVALMFATLAAYYLIANPDPVLLTIGAVNIAVVLWKYRADLRQPPGLRPWILRRIERV